MPRRWSETLSQIASQARSVHSIRRHSRLNTAFMATMLRGGAAYSLWDWTGTCAFGAISAALALSLSR